ncbi:protein NUCLEAR FUSION DEFECTIVE 4-like [Euphorbia lathyris]|uniref:protein NUCLEAR FUSION DEFECTIVE 4-like n=1 Tax=Euphorbia lathyris TaxID=212925 RepID=UPI0033142882
MEGQSRKWMVLVATIWIQAFTGTNLDFPSYSSTLKSVLGISQLQLNFLAVASDMGKVFGWCSGFSLMHFPLWLVMFFAAFMGLFAYGLQWLLLSKFISLPYSLVFMLCLTAGCSICWFNTVSFVLCIKNFPTNRALALSLTISFNGVSAALYFLIANAIDPTDNTLYLLLNALVPLLVSILALLPILHQLPSHQLASHAATPLDSYIFLILYILAIFTGLYLLLLNPLSYVSSTACILLGGAIFLLLIPLCLPALFSKNLARLVFRPNSNPNDSRFNLVDTNNLELVKELIGSTENGNSLNGNISNGMIEKEGCWLSCFWKVIEKQRLTMLGEEHPAYLTVRKWDFWLYYFTYLCGGTIGLVYSNNLGQIAESLGYNTYLSSLITLYSSMSFFGRLLSAAPDFLRNKVYFARTGWLAVAIVPMPIGLFLLVLTGSKEALYGCTCLVGLSSGFVFAAAVSITSELFGPNSAGVNHNILITNIPIGSLVYGLFAAIVYDSNAGSRSLLQTLVGVEMVCMGRQCYMTTFIAWTCISLVGVVSGFVLFLRTRPAYDRFERDRT